MKNFQILGIVGSLRLASYNKSLMRAAEELLPEGVSLTVADIGSLPLFNQDSEKNPPPQVRTLKKQVREADAVLIATPEYNYSIPGVLKNAIDWASRPHGDNCFEGKPVAVMGASTGMLGTGRAQYHLRQCFVFLDMHAINRPEIILPEAAKSFDADGNLTNEQTKKLISQMLQALVGWARRLAG